MLDYNLHTFLNESSLQMRHIDSFKSIQDAKTSFKNTNNIEFFISIFSLLTNRKYSLQPAVIYHPCSYRRRKNYFSP